MSLLEFEKKYWESLDNQYKQLISLYEEIKSNASISLKQREITKAILLRMKTYYDTQNKIKKFLNKRYLSAASDFFVEAVAFYLKLIFDMKGTDLEVHSERQIKPRRGSIRPDISVWKNDEVVATVECKTQLGWNRDKWEDDFQKRESKLKREFPKAKAFLIVMTSENWSGFPDDSKKIGEQYFTLSSTWPTNISDDNINNVIMNLLRTCLGKFYWAQQQVTERKNEKKTAQSRVKVKRARKMKQKVWFHLLAESTPDKLFNWSLCGTTHVYS